MMDTLATEKLQRWLASQIGARDWNYSELAEKAGLSPATISLVMKGERGVGPDFCNAVARALNIPPDEVFRQAGLLPPVPEQDAVAENALHLFRHLTVADQERILAMMRVLATLSKAEEKGEK